MPSAADLVLSAEHVMTPQGVRPATISIVDGRITDVKVGPDRLANAGAAWELGDVVVSPGFVDVHVHCNDPGRVNWEGFGHATAAAAAGGTTTVIDMPLNSLPPTLDRAALEQKRAAATGTVHVDVGIWGGAVPDNLGELDELMGAGVFGAKCFLTDSGVPEFPPLMADEQLEAALAILARWERPLLVHAEDDAVLRQATFDGDRGDYRAWLASRPAEAEARAIERVAAALARVGGRAHIVHVSSEVGLAALRRAQQRGLALSGETCPHYLALAAEELPEGAVAAKCAPPIRAADDRRALWRALETEVLAAVASDHSPSPQELKGEGDLLTAWGGISSLQVWARVVWTEAVKRGHSVAELTQWTAVGPARWTGLSRKGAIAVGCDADLVVWDPTAPVVVNPERLESRHPHSPYAGRRLLGQIRTTLVRGRVAWDANDGLTEPRGQLLSAE